MKKRALSLALALVMALYLLPAAAFAADSKPVKIGNITLSDVVITEEYGTAKELLDESSSEYEFLYDLGMIGFELEGEYGYGSFWCYLIPDDAEIVFDLTKERSVQVDFYDLKSVSASWSGPAYQADFISGLNPADSSVSKWGVSKEDVDEYGDVLAAYDLMLCYSGNQDPVYVMFESKAIALAFTDVAEGAWYADAVNWAVAKEITNGTDKTHFSPDLNCTQAQILTFLYRADRGKGPATAADMDKAVEWAKAKGIIGDDFDGSKACTRSTAVSYIWQALGGKKAAQAASFSDVAADAPYADAVSWAVEKGVTKGDGGEDTFAPDKVCTRGHIVTFLQRAYKD